MVKNKYTFRGMAARMGTNKNWVHTHVALLNASPAIQKMVEDRPDTRTHVLPIKAVGEDYLQRRLIKLVVEEEYSARRVRELSASIIMIQKLDDLDSEKKKKFIDKVFSNNWAPSDVCEALGIAEVLPQVVTAHGEASSENSFSPGSAMTQMNPSQGFMAPMSENFGLLGPASSGMTPTIHANDRIHAFGGITRGTGDHPAISVLAQAVRFIEQAERDSRARQVTRDEYNAILDMIEKISSASESIINVIREAPEEEEVSNDDYFDTDRVM